MVSSFGSNMCALPCMCPLLNAPPHLLPQRLHGRRTCPTPCLPSSRCPSPTLATVRAPSRCTTAFSARTEGLQTRCRFCCTTRGAALATTRRRVAIAKGRSRCYDDALCKVWPGLHSEQILDLVHIFGCGGETQTHGSGGTEVQ